jgi:PAS domain S-box-containing protein
VKVLLIEDNPDHAYIEQRALERELGAEVVVETRPEAGLERLRLGGIDVVLLDYHLPEQDGLDVLRRIKEGRVDLPVILITSFGNEEVAVAAMKEGASDYLVKRFGGEEDNEKLAAAVRRSLTQAELHRAVRRSQDLMRKTLDLAWDGVAHVNLRSRRVIGANPSLCRMIGVAERALDGEPWAELFAPEDQAALERMEIFFRDATPPPVPATVTVPAQRFELEARLARRDGTVILVELRAVEVEIDGEPCALVTVRDVSEKKRLHEQLVQAQKMQAVGTLAGGIAHDFNNLLGAILGYASYLKRHIRPEDRLYKSVETIEAAGERAAELVRRLLSFSRRGPTERKPFSPNQVVEETERLVARTISKSITIRMELAAGLPACDGDFTQVQQVLLNVCLNARDAMTDGGVLTLTTALARPGEAPPGLDSPPFGIRRASAGRFIVITIGDTGVGMPPEIRERMFEPFFTTKAPGKGTGLGLATAYAIVKAHGGGIDVASDPGRGTEVRVFLPASDRPPESRRAEEGSERAKGQGTILVVDDEVAIRDLTTDILEERGYSVLLAASGKEALEVATARRGAIDLVILDIIMPGMNGLETLRRLRELEPGLRVLLSSGYSPDGVAQEALQTGAIGFVQKPYRVTDLATAVRSALQAPKK